VIQEIVAAYYNIPREELASKKKTAMIAYTRQVSMYLMRKILDESLTNIGDYHGGRHHSTVVHAINQIAQKCETSDEFKNTLYELENRIKGIK
jgi:chromosomal replication initiator protein